jgi:excisionase family DNA binding protein
MKLVSVKELSEMLNVKPSTLYQWAELGQIPCIKLNGVLRFDVEDINQWINSCKKQVTSDYHPPAKMSGAAGYKKKK